MDRAERLHADWYDREWTTARQRARDALRPFWYPKDKARWQAIFRVMDRTCGRYGGERQAFDLGCGRGAFAGQLLRLGWRVAGLDLSPAAIAVGRQKWPALDLHAGSMFAFDPYPRCDLVVSTEVMEHVEPERRAAYVDIFRRALVPGGVGIVTTPNRIAWHDRGVTATNQPVDHWLDASELGACFAGFDVLWQGTTCWTPKHSAADIALRLVPGLARAIDRRTESTQAGAYHAFRAPNA